MADDESVFVSQTLLLLARSAFSGRRREATSATAAHSAVFTTAR